MIWDINKDALNRCLLNLTRRPPITDFNHLGSGQSQKNCLETEGILKVTELCILQIKQLKLQQWRVLPKGAEPRRECELPDSLPAFFSLPPVASYFCPGLSNTHTSFPWFLLVQFTSVWSLSWSPTSLFSSKQLTRSHCNKGKCRQSMN